MSSRHGARRQAEKGASFRCGESGVASFETPRHEAIVRQRIRRFDPFQAAKVSGVLYALVGLLFCPIFYIASRAAPNATGFGIGFVILVSVLYGVGGFIFTLIGAALYNVVAGWVGGIEVALEAVAPPQ